MFMGITGGIYATREKVIDVEYVYSDTLAKISDIPTKTSDLTNDSGYLTAVNWADVNNKPEIPTYTDIRQLSSRLMIKLIKSLISQLMTVHLFQMFLVKQMFMAMYIKVELLPAIILIGNGLMVYNTILEL